MSKMDVQKIIAPMMKFVNMRGIIALKDGMLAILPLTVVGSLFLIMGQLPFEELNKSIASVFGANWTEPFMQVYSGTFAIMGLISCFSIAYSYAKKLEFYLYLHSLFCEDHLMSVNEVRRLGTLLVKFGLEAKELSVLSL